MKIFFATAVFTSMVFLAASVPLPDETNSVDKKGEPLSLSAGTSDKSENAATALTEPGNSDSRVVPPSSNGASWSYEGMTDQITGLHVVEAAVTALTGIDFRQEHQDKRYKEIDENIRKSKG
ncbi:unnamed protein product [Allacma fusca]|uniref:Uncharacterized protein n=1 Tax=Allacma fusca TaxID=39272 RepID=A0A8J2Q6A1_9HEXA|nr:unnamed protein product [Allacma fusca]